MPTTYAHDSFGRKVYYRVPEAVKKIIREHISLYRIGLHGPDILFYFGLSKNYVNQTGVRLHGEKAMGFFERGIALAQKDQDEALLAYLLGFACHFMLDSTCHPYIYHIAPEVSHTIIEKEMDRRLMEEDGLNPLTYFPARGIFPTRKNARVIGKMFPDIPVRMIRRALRGMRRSTGLMIYGTGLRRKIIMPLLQISGQKKSVGEHFMTKYGDDKYDPYLDELDELYYLAVKDAPSVLEAVYDSYTVGKLLPMRFDRNYRS